MCAKTLFYIGIGEKQLSGRESMKEVSAPIPSRYLITKNRAVTFNLPFEPTHLQCKASLAPSQLHIEPWMQTL